MNRVDQNRESGGLQEPAAPYSVASGCRWPCVAPGQWQQSQDAASRLRQLEQLKQSGLLSDAEYAERRRQILGQL